MNLGGSIGVALIGSIVIAMLASTFSGSVALNPKVPQQVKLQVEVATTTFPDFVSVKELAAAAKHVGVSAQHTAELVKEYTVAQLTALQTGFAVLAVFALVALVWFLMLPREQPEVKDETRARVRAGT